MQIHQPFPISQDGSVNIDEWIRTLHVPDSSLELLKTACHLAEITGSDQLTDLETNCFLAGLEIAEMLNNQHFDIESIVAGLLYPVAAFADLAIEDISEQISENVGALVSGVHQLNLINQFQEKDHPLQRQQIDNIRKMLLAMVRDVRVVAIKLVEHLSRMRAIRGQAAGLRRKLALETRDIFAPLASRLGLEKIKWELEDLAFRELEPKLYGEIAEKLAEKRSDREGRVAVIVDCLTKKAMDVGISGAIIYGRSKHIYSIYKKMHRKHLSFEEIFDISAVRIIVPEEKDCYKMLSFVHELWEPIQKEFDDYIANPKPNGYQSIHTVIKDFSGKYCEVQVRTAEMHEKAESGVAAHWFYKENGKKLSSFDAKIDWLRSLLEWHKEMVEDESSPSIEKDILEDRVYVFTPAGDILDMSTGSTSLDFAYQIHTEVGHRCRGAKINGHIMPLTYQLQTGDRIEIITAKQSAPSRDWLIPRRGYLHTAGARAKVLSWFKNQDVDRHISEGRAMIDRECQRLNIHNPDLIQAATKLNYVSTEKMLAALGGGSLRLAQVMGGVTEASKEKLPPLEAPLFVEKPSVKKTSKDQVLVQGVGNLLSHIAKCCKPVPGDPIIGYITQGKGVAVHHQDCKNIAYASNSSADRLIQVCWNDTAKKSYPVDLEVLVYNRPGILRDLSNILANENINILSLNTASNQSESTTRIFITIEVDSIERLGKILDHLHQVPNVYQVTRSGGHERKNY